MDCADTSLLIDLLDPEADHHAAADAWYADHNGPLFAPAFVKWEVYRGADDRLGAVRTTLEDVVTLDLTEAAAAEAARIEHETRAAGEQLSAPDCLVAGTVREAGGTLVTRDSDFAVVDDLDCELYVGE